MTPPPPQPHGLPVRAVLMTIIATLLVAAVLTTAFTQPAPGWDPAAAPEARVNINTADAATLALLSGIGPALAERIIETRQQRPFTDADDLQRVSGIGPTIAARLAPHIVYAPEPASH
ncbi:MAG: ComEA family DNA-binding protein [Phycisphaeraceae bacterium]